MKETKLPISHTRSCYARRSSSVTVVFLKKSVSSEISPSTVFVMPRVGEEEAAIAVLSILESCPRVINVGRRSNESSGSMNSGVSHGAVNGEGNRR
jgi:hypothetical protein